MKNDIFGETGKARILDRTVALFNGINPYVFILLVLVLFYMRFTLSVNEEHYMALAKQFFNPEWIANSFFLNEFASTRLLYQVIIGWPLQFFSFETVAAVGKFLLAALTAWPLSRLYRQLGLSNIDVLLHLPLLFFVRQAFIADEFILLTLEPKGFGYAFVFFALYYMLLDKHYTAIIFAVIATYFHVLVGGWFIVYYGIYHLVSARSLKKSLLLGLFCAAFIIPFFIYISSSVTENFSRPDTPVNTDWIFTYVKQPFHTALLASFSYFVKDHLQGTLAFAGFFMLCVFLFSRYRDELNLKINRMNMLIFAGVFTSLLLSWFDKNGAFVKYFPFRINSLFTFLVFLQAVMLVRHFLIKKEALVYLHFGVLVLFLFTSFPKAAYGFLIHDGYRHLTGKAVDPSFAEITTYIRDNTAREDVVMPLSKFSVPGAYATFESDPSLMRRMERDNFWSFRSAPNSPGTDAMYQWYLRLQAKESAVEDYRNLCEIRKEFTINYVLSDFKMENLDCTRLIFNNGSYYLYALENK